MKTWLKALLSETAFSVWWILSGLSTLATFFFPSWSGKPRLASAISTVLGFAWANFRIFQKQEKRISALNAELSAREARTSELRITPDNGSRYILAPAAGVRHGDFNGGFLEFHLMVENVGGRNSTVRTYHVEVVELGQTFRDLRPIEGQNGVEGRHCHHTLHPSRVLSRTGVVKIDAERATDRGTLFFFIPGITLERFAQAGLGMHGEERRFGTLRCRLTLIDTTNSSATAEFELHEE